MNEQTDDAVIRDILRRVRTVAVIGASAKPARPSHGVMAGLQAKGYRIIPVNPGLAGQEILGETVYPSLAQVPAPIDMVDIFRNSEDAGTATDETIAAAPDKGISVVWMQLGVRNEAAAARARAAGLDVVMDRCPMIEYPRLMR